MKITVSSTSMMKPLLHTDQTSRSYQQHPQRLIGLLEIAKAQSNASPIATFNRPHKTCSTQIPFQWQLCMQILDRHSQLCAAVFGFEFDGEQTWYQLWNTETNQLFWLLHEDDMDYQPYAILAMDKLVSLIPQWNGELCVFPKLGVGAHDLANLKQKSVDNSGDHKSKYRENPVHSPSYDLFISDSATNATGQLWFLVTLRHDQLNADLNANSAQVRTGWISHSGSMASAA